MLASVPSFSAIRYSGVSPTTIGAIGELRACVDLLAKGYEVFRTVSQTSSCDLIVLKNGKILRIEVRTGYRSRNGKLRYTKNLEQRRPDHYAIALPGNEMVYDPKLY